MKKLILLFTIACVGQLYGMEEPSYGSLPKELKQEVMNTALAASKNVDDAVNAIKALGALHGVPYSTQTALDLLIKTLPNDLDKAIDAVKNLQGTKPEDFTKLVHILADKFGKPTEDVADLFNTPIADMYNMLGNKFMTLLSDYKYLTPIDDFGASVKEAKGLITKGLDPNYSWGSNSSILRETYNVQNYYAPLTVLDILKVLLDAGANPTALIELVQDHIYEFYMENGFNDDVAIEVLNLLEQYEK